MSKHNDLTSQDRADIACQLERVENEYGDHQSTEYLVLCQLLFKLGLMAGTIGGVIALAHKIANGSG